MNKFIMLNFSLVLFASTYSYVANATPEEDAACCPPGYTFHKRNTTCLDLKSNIISPISLLNNQTVILVASDIMTLTVDHNGQLLVKLKNREPTEYPPRSFCMATHITRTKHNVTKTNRLAVLSFSTNSDQRAIHDSIRGYCMTVSTLFLLATVVIFACRPELRTQQGVSVINLCLSLGMGLGILAYMILLPYSDMTFCAVRGFLVYFFLMASFFWTNVISLQILKDVRSSGSACEPTRRQCIWYAMYAWGFSVLFTLIVAIVNYMPGEHLKPGIGLNHCWFFNSKQQWIYMYSVMTILIAVNIGIFVYVTCLLWSSSLSGQRSSKFKILMTMRLFVMTGMPWIHEMISSLALHHVVWEVMDILNSLQGVFIFVVLVLYPLLLSEEGAYHYDLNISICQPYEKINLHHSTLPSEKDTKYVKFNSYENTSLTSAK